MERYHISSARAMPMIRVGFTNIHDDEDCFYFDISPGDYVSVLYIDNTHQVGMEKEYVINGKVEKILCRKDDRICEACDRDSYIYSLLLDAGEDYSSRYVKLNLHNILDINQYPHEYDLKEDIKVIPDLKERFIVKEMAWPQEIDTAISIDPVFGDCEFIEKEDTNNE